MGEIKATLRLASGKALQGELRDVGLESVTIDVPARALSALERGARVTLALNGGQLPEDCLSDVHIETFREDGGHGRVVLRYVDRDELSRILAKGVGQQFNRRGSFRIEPDPRHPVQVHVATSAGETVSMQALDVSGTGVAAAGDEAGAATLSVGKRVNVRLEVPGSPRPLEFVAEVRYHRPEADVLHVGLMFDPDRTRGFATAQDHLIDYIMRRQRELLRTRIRK